MTQQVFENRNLSQEGRELRNKFICITESHKETEIIGPSTYEYGGITKTENNDDWVKSV